MLVSFILSRIQQYLRYRRTLREPRRLVRPGTRRHRRRARRDQPSCLGRGQGRRVRGHHAHRLPPVQDGTPQARPSGHALTAGPPSGMTANEPALRRAFVVRRPKNPVARIAARIHTAAQPDNARASSGPARTAKQRRTGLSRTAGLPPSGSAERLLPHCRPCVVDPPMATPPRPCPREPPWTASSNFSVLAAPMARAS